MKTSKYLLQNVVTYNPRKGVYKFNERAFKIFSECLVAEIISVLVLGKYLHQL